MKFVRTDALGLVIPPSNIDCVGPESCPYVESDRGCYSSGHHLYFEEDYYKDHSELAWQFREDPNNKVAMARCQEDRIHDRFDGARVPTEFIMELFLEESAILQGLDIYSRRVLSADKALVNHVKMAEKVEEHLRLRGKEGVDGAREYWDRVGNSASYSEYFRRKRASELAGVAGFTAISPALLRAKGYHKIAPELFSKAA